MRFFKWLLERQITYEEALEIFGVSRKEAQNKEQLNKQWKKLALQHHPDRGGNVEMMQKINVAYNILKRGGETKFSGPSKPSNAEQEFKKQKERDEQRRKTYERNKKIQDLVKQTLDIDKFSKYFESLSGKEFRAQVDWYNVEKIGNVCGKVVFKSSDNETTITLNFVVWDKLPDKEKLKTDDLTVSISREVFHNNKKHKIGKQTFMGFEFDVLTQPSKLFSKQKLNTILFGSKSDKFKKKDMISFFKNKIGASIQERGGNLIARIPVGDDFKLVLYRSTIMRQSSWSINGLYHNQKKVHLGKMITLRENKETAEFFEYLVKEMQKFNTESSKINIMDSIISRYKKQKGM